MKSNDLSGALTLEMFPLPKRRGRPRSGRAMSNRERQRIYRQRHESFDLGDSIGATVSRFARDFDLPKDEVIRHLLRFALCNRNWEQTGFSSAS